MSDHVDERVKITAITHREGDELVDQKGFVRMGKRGAMTRTTDSSHDCSRKGLWYTRIEGMRVSLTVALITSVVWILI